MAFARVKLFAVLHECWVQLSGKYAVRLSAHRVCEEPEGWEWRVTDAGAERDLYRGSTTTLTSAQIAAQMAFERWLQRNRLSIDGQTPEFYDWSLNGSSSHF